ncbi:MAG: DNA polymerase III subunit alpha [Candidatus Yanofskybacteria bacterium]|nr:DNA polymerase III subunit alpha [Candidatus Yanofskybacteria bacterium]
MDNQPIKFCHLHTHTHYSLLDGLTRIDELVAHAKEIGMESVAITDHGAMYGVIEFYQKAKKAGIKPIIGCEMYVTENMHDKRPSGGSGKSNGNYFHLILLAENNTGYKNLIKLVTAAHLDGFYYKPRVDRGLLRQHSQGLIALSACLGGEVSRALLSNQYDKAKRVALEYREIFGDNNFFLEIQQHPNIEDQNVVTPKVVQLSRETGIPLVATQDSHYLRSEDAHAHDVLLAVQTGSSTDDKDRLTMRHDDFSLLPADKMAEKFKDWPEAIENTAKIAERCNVEIELGKTQLPSYPLPPGHTADSYLKELAHAGLAKRYGENAGDALLTRLNYELGIIEKTGFASYFLIVQDFVNWAKSQKIVVGPGRGSAAGSLVSYLLNITNVDPLKYDLLFERFLNPERVSMPDIDLDFDDARRDEVFDYVREKYGSDHFAQIITFGTMAARGGIRDAGRALGFSYDFCDRLAKLIPFNPNQNEKIGFLKKCLSDVEELRQIYNTSADAKTVIDAAMRLEGVARHSSTHACAVVITPKPLTEYLPLQRDTEGGAIITQYEMHSVDDLGLLKMDFLGLSNLTIIESTLNQVKKNYGVEINIDDLPLDDAATFKLLREGHTTGVFQLEGSGMRRYLKELKPTRLEDIIVMISLYRPGPLDAGMVKEYIERKNGKKAITYLHPTLKPILENTYGIIVYQEQLMQMANSLAKFTLPQGYTLIKAVGKKIRSLLEEQKAKLIDGMVNNEIDQKTAEKIWDFIEPFARYGFNKSHAACYATIAYQTAYLKAHYPVEFMAALMNSESGDVERIAFLIEECRERGLEVLPPEINESMEKFSVVANSVSDTNSKKIRFGLAAVKNVGVNIVQAVIAEREKDGRFKDVDDFARRVQHKDLNKKSLESLIRCGALDLFGERAVLLASVDQLLYYSRESSKAHSTGQVSLFDGPDAQVTLPPLRLASVDPATRAEKLMWEKELLGLFITDHPLKDYQQQLNFEKGIIQIKEIAGKRNDSLVKVGGLVTKIQKIVTKNGKTMVFSWIEDLTGKVETVVFPNVLEANPETFVENKVLVISGKLNDRDGIPKILCDTVRSIATLS